jgi:hypothetical protein
MGWDITRFMISLVRRGVLVFTHPSSRFGASLISLYSPPEVIDRLSNQATGLLRLYMD